MKKLIFISSFFILLSCQIAKKMDGGSSLASTADVASQIDRIVAKKTVAETDVSALFDAVGESISPDEGQMLFDFFKGKKAVEIPDPILKLALDRALMFGLFDEEKKRLKQGVAASGVKIPAKVLEILSWAKLSGATPYDVSEKDPDDSSKGLWSPYPQRLFPSSSLAFTVTHISKESLAADMADKTIGNRITGVQNGTVTYKKDACLDSRGDITSNYDEADHPDYFARGTSCQKWANNCAILFDGSLHCLLAPRRNPVNPNLILTNPSLGRGTHMLFNGHINARAGVVTSIGTSGRIAKKAARAQNVFVDPRPLIEAWGIKVNTNVQTSSEHYETAPKFHVDPESFTLRSKN